MSDQFIKSAFETVCKEAKQANGFYVVLIESAPYYGGAEEGGWWGRDNIVLAYQFFSTEEAAQAACDKVKVLAKELQEQSQKNHGEHCLNQMEWLEERGLDSDCLPEVDGPSEYNVIVSEGLPESTYGCRVYS